MRWAVLSAALALSGCLSDPKTEAPPERGGPAPVAALPELKIAVAYSPKLIAVEALQAMLPGAQFVPVAAAMDPVDLRARLANLAPDLVVLLDGAPDFALGVGTRAIMTDVPYEDLNGDGTPGTRVARLSGAPALIAGRLRPRAPAAGTLACVAGNVDPRVHWEARLLTEWFAELGYTVSPARDPAARLLAEPGTATPLSILDGEAIAGLRCSFSEGWEAPARHNNEMFEHVVEAHRRLPNSTLHGLMVEARARFLTSHPELREALADLLATRHAADNPELLTFLGWQATGSPFASIPAVGAPALPFRRPDTAVLTHPSVIRRWEITYDLKDDEAMPVLKLLFEVLPQHRTSARLIVEQNGEVLYRIEAGAETRYAAPEPLCLGGRSTGTRLAGRFLLPLRERTRSEVVVRLDREGPDSDGLMKLLPGSAVEIWKHDYAGKNPAARLAAAPPEGGLTRRAAAAARPVQTIHGIVSAARHAGTRYHLVDLSGVVNRVPGEVGVGQGSFATWFPGDRAEHRRVPFRIDKKVLVAAGGGENAFVLTGLNLEVKKVHLLVWGYEFPAATVPIEMGFSDGESRSVSLPLQEWTRAEPPPAFDFKNTAAFDHASIYHEVLEVPRRSELIRLESREGAFGLVAITLEE